MSTAEQRFLRANVAQASDVMDHREKSDIDRHSRRGTEARGKKKEASHKSHARLVLVLCVNFTPSVRYNAKLAAPKSFLFYFYSTYST